MKPIDRIISFFREEGMMTANPPGGSGGFGGEAPAKGPRAGFDPVMKKVGRRGSSYIYDDTKYGKFVERTWEMLPLPVRLVGKEPLGYNNAMFTLRNTVFGKDEEEPSVNEEDEGFIKKTIMGRFR